MPRPEYRLLDLVARFGGRVLGDEHTRISQVGTLEKAGAGQIAFLANARYRKQLEHTQAAAVILSEADAEATSLPRIVCSHPYSYFAKLSAFLNPMPACVPGIHPSAVIEPGAEISPEAEIGPLVHIAAGAKIGAGTVIEAGCAIGARSVIGSGCHFYPRVVVYHDCIIGNGVIAHSGAVIGSDGFGIAWEDGRWLKIPQIGRVIIGDDVEIGANTTLDRGALDDTVVEEGVKLDNQIQIAHNAHVGAHTAMAGHSGVAGSGTVGKYCRIGAYAGVAGHLQVADNTEIAAYTMISKSINEPGGSYSGGMPSAPTTEWRRNAVHMRNLDEMARRIRALEKEIEALKRSEA